MKKVKFLFKLLVCFLIFFTLTACTNNENNSSDNNESSNQNTEISGGDGDILVAYFSATNTTKRIAEFIVDLTGADTFVITPTEQYTSADLNWSDSNSRVSREHNDLNRNVELVTTDVENWENYTTIFIGYPIWWYDASWVVNNFVTENDFTGKTIIPFCTSSSSQIGDSGKKLATLAGEGTWLDGHRFTSSSSKNDVSNWLNTLNI